MPEQNIFTTELPAISDQQDSTYTLGTLFSSDVDGYILGVRVYVTGIPSTGPFGALYEWTSNDTGDYLNSREFEDLELGWNEVRFVDPVPITAGTTYVTAWGPTNNYCATSNFFASAPTVNGHLTAPKTESSALNGKFHVGGSLTYPDESFNDGCYFIDTIFVESLDETPSYTKNSFFFG
jgi:hypothetical protein